MKKLIFQKELILKYLKNQKNAWSSIIGFLKIKNLILKNLFVMVFMTSWNYYDVKLNKCKVKNGTSLRFWENKSWINEIDPYGWFQWYFRYFLGRRSSDEFRQANRWKKVVSRFKGKLVKVIKDSGGKIDDYAISPKIRHISLHWG